MTEYLLCLDKPNIALNFKSGKNAYSALRKIARVNKTHARVYRYENSQARLLWVSDSHFERDGYMLEISAMNSWANYATKWYKWRSRETIFSSYNDFLSEDCSWRIFRVNGDHIGIPIQGNLD